CVKNRKAIIEPLFDLISRLLDTTSNHKQLPIKGKENVRSCLGLGVMLTQLALLMNSIYGLPFHNISHMLTMFL
ncbi:MAG: Tnp dom protein, partial [Candidatus Poribacteria bacterium]|nr:Tnp dom protein [Candidatus Poribacteria bacterium]